MEVQFQIDVNIDNYTIERNKSFRQILHSIYGEFSITFVNSGKVERYPNEEISGSCFMTVFLQPLKSSLVMNNLNIQMNLLLARGCKVNRLYNCINRHDFF